MIKKINDWLKSFFHKDPIPVRVGNLKAEKEAKEVKLPSGLHLTNCSIGTLQVLSMHGNDLSKKELTVSKMDGLIDMSSSVQKDVDLSYKNTNIKHPRYNTFGASL